MERLAVTPTEMAALTGCSVATIYRAIKRGEIEAVLVSGKKLIPARALTEKFGLPVEVAV